jgi:saccharopine dehydrogenase-like NADP-dependent oxidoreductase
LYHLGLFASEPMTLGDVQLIPRQMTARQIAEHVPLCQRDRTVVRVEFAGREHGQARSHRLEIIDEYDPVNRLTSMMRMTAFPAAIISQMQCDGRITMRGVLPQEVAADPDQFVAELTRRGIAIRGLDGAGVTA